MIHDFREGRPKCTGGHRGINICQLVVKEAPDNGILYAREGLSLLLGVATNWNMRGRSRNKPRRAITGR